jgi:hypothetical protein
MCVHVCACVAGEGERGVHCVLTLGVCCGAVCVTPMTGMEHDAQKAIVHVPWSARRPVWSFASATTKTAAAAATRVAGVA